MSSSVTVIIQTEARQYLATGNGLSDIQVKGCKNIQKKATYTVENICTVYILNLYQHRLMLPLCASLSNSTIMTNKKLFWICLLHPWQIPTYKQSNKNYSGIFIWRHHTVRKINAFGGEAHSTLLMYGMKQHHWVRLKNGTDLSQRFCSLVQLVQCLISFLSDLIELLTCQHLIETLVLTAAAVAWLLLLCESTHPGSLTHTFSLSWHPNPVWTKNRSR